MFETKLRKTPNKAFHVRPQSSEKVDTGTLIIVPTYNERESLALLIPALLKTYPKIDMLVVDDGSPDGTGDFAESLSEKTGRVSVLRRPGKQGLGTAYIAGFRYALGRGYERVVQMDADLSHRPEDLRLLLEGSESADLVIGSRNVLGGRVENWPLLRRIVSKGGSFYARTLLGLPVRDCTSGFKCFRRSVLEALDLDEIESNGYGFQVEMDYLAYKAGFKLLEVPIVFPDRENGSSKMSWRIFLEASLLVPQLRLNQILSGSGISQAFTRTSAARRGGDSG